ncbi:hypothetical protein A6X21_01340 [Planctopirus hydrillae]|uniref:Uncharacterized protein n=1 Tax=Planctopirus hydrillae TaxID=1841610 RepID=A0A1C3E4W1_9PLAN|nr:hypothetical protein A6X21_01340 [Planctopirus hydrillae]
MAANFLGSRAKLHLFRGSIGLRILHSFGRWILETISILETLIVATPAMPFQLTPANPLSFP